MSSDAAVRPPRAPGTVAEMVRAASGSLPPAEARVAQALLTRGADVVHSSVTEVALAADTGVGTVVRACQSLGFKGFQAAKIALAQDLLPLDERPRTDVAEGDSPAEVLAKLADASGDALRRAVASVAPDALGRATELIAGARRVLCLGVGTSAPLAQDTAYRLATIGIDADAPPDVHVQHVRARLLKENDVALAVSHTGATQETLGAVRGAREAGAAIIAITSFSTTPLTELADVALVAGGRETRYRVEAMASRLAHLLVIDTLYTSLVLASPRRAQPAQQLTADVLAEHRY
ncbi:MAG TPA: MurR/RpiR family transcriptional regulator [Streptosporangiaceae bacterium]|jgi:RpiR family transcriptional regulator, carbohydrate utilization regulator|nr:MurR/RpiR family transcriptional regulator [Streptosporangiaceae bacterium]